MPGCRGRLQEVRKMTGIARKEKVYEGKAKIVYSTDDPDRLIVFFKDSATAFNGRKKGTIVGKGAANARISSVFFYSAMMGFIGIALFAWLSHRPGALEIIRMPRRPKAAMTARPDEAKGGT